MTSKLLANVKYGYIPSVFAKSNDWPPFPGIHFLEESIPLYGIEDFLSFVSFFEWGVVGRKTLQ